MLLKEAIDNCIARIEAESMSQMGGYLPHSIRGSKIKVDDVYFALLRLYGWRVNKGFIRGQMAM